MNKLPFILIILFLVSLFVASAQLNLPPPPQAPGFDMQEQAPPDPVLPGPVVQTPQVTPEQANLQNLQQIQQLQAQVSSLQSTVDTLNNENQRLKQEMRLQTERKPRATTFFYIIFFLSIALNIVLIVIYLLKHTKHKPEFETFKQTEFTARPALKPEPKKPESKKEIEELKKYLLNAAKQGLTFDEVHDVLKKAGWPEDLIEKAYDEIQHGL